MPHAMHMQVIHTRLELFQGGRGGHSLPQRWMYCITSTGGGLTTLTWLNGTLEFPPVQVMQALLCDGELRDCAWSGSPDYWGGGGGGGGGGMTHIQMLPNS